MRKTEIDEKWRETADDGDKWGMTTTKAVQQYNKYLASNLYKGN